MMALFFFLSLEKGVGRFGGCGQTISFLFELLPQVWVCAATEQVVVDRLVASRKMTPEEVRQRMAMQVDSRPYASRVFITEDTVEVLERKVDAAFAELVRPGSGGPDRSEL